MKVSRSELIELFAELGVPTAQGWGEIKLRKRLSQLPDIESRPKTQEMKDLHSNLLELLEEDAEIKITGFEEAAVEETEVKEKQTRPAKAHTEKNGRSAKNGKVGRGKTSAEKPAVVAGKHPGIWRAIVDVLRKGSEEKPVTKAQILAVLVKKFPDRDPNGMKRTIAGLRTKLPGEKGVPLKVTDGGKGFWCPPAPAGCRY